MSDENQTIVPPSFIAVFVPEGRIKPTESKEHIAQRYELCEDLAIALIDRARAILWEDKVPESLVLARVRDGLKQEGSGVDAKEADWIAHRLAELLEWRLMG